MPIYSIQGPDGNTYSIEGPEGATREQVINAIQLRMMEQPAPAPAPAPVVAPPPPSGGFFPALARGAIQTQSLITDIIPAMVGRAIGADEYAEQQFKEAAEKEKLIQEKYAAAVPSYKDIKGVGDFVTYVTESVGELVPSIVPSLITGGAAGVLGRGAIIAAKEAAEVAARKGIAQGLAADVIEAKAKEAGLKAAANTALKYEAVGAVAGSSSQNIPDVYKNIKDETGQESLGTALLFGGFNSLLDAALPIATLAKIKKAGIPGEELMGEWYKRFGKGAVKGFATEGATEAAQEMSSAAAEKFVDENKEFFTEKNLERFLNAGLKGGLGGGVVSGSTDVMLGKKKPTEDELIKQLRPGETLEQGINRIYGDLTANRAFLDELHAMQAKEGQTILNDDALKSMGFKKDDPLYPAIIDKDLNNTQDSSEVVDLLKAAIADPKATENQKTLYADSLSVIEPYLSTRGVPSVETVTAPDGAGVPVAGVPSVRAAAPGVGVLEPIRVAPAPEITGQPPAGAPVVSPPVAPSLKAVPVETPAPAPIEAPAEVQTPAPAPIEAPSQAPVAAPAAAPVEAPVAAPVEPPAPPTTEDLIKTQQERIGKLTQDFQTLLQHQINRYGLKDVAVNVVSDLKDANGTYSNRLIKLAIDADDPVRDLRHEAIHAMKELGVFTPAQWTTLMKMASDKWIDQHLKGKNISGNAIQEGEQSRHDAYRDLYGKRGMSEAQIQEALVEEAIADAFGGFAQTKAPPGFLSAILNRMNNFFRAIKETVGMSAPETAEQIFGKVAQGKLAPKEKAVAPTEEAKPVETEEKFSLAPKGIPKNIWDLHEKSIKATEEASGEITREKGLTPGGTKRNQTMSFRRLNNAVMDFVGGDEQKSLDLMSKMNAISGIRDAIKSEDSRALDMYKVTNKEEYDQEVAPKQVEKPSLRIMRGQEKPTFDGRITTDKIGKYFDNQIIDEFGRPLDYNNPQDFNRALKIAGDEVNYQLKQEKSGLDWYEDDVRLAFEDTAKVIPQLDDPTNRVLFSVIAGIMSPQTTARDNWFIAAKAYEHFVKTEDVPGVNPASGKLWQGGTTSVNKRIQLEFLNRMIKDMGVDGAVKWLLVDHSVRDINQFRQKYGNIKSGIDGKLNDIKPGLYAFGPKVGPFVSNLNGIHDVTVDQWMIRTFNRYFGTMIGPDGKIIDAPTEPQRRAVKDLVNKVAENANIKPYQVQSLLWFYEQKLYDKIGLPTKSYGFSDGGKRFLEEARRGGGAPSVAATPAPVKPKKAIKSERLSIRAPKTDEFERFFEGSKARDEEGNPLLYYHGSVRDKRMLRPKVAGAIFFSPDPSFAEGYIQYKLKELAERPGEYLSAPEIRDAVRQLRQYVYDTYGRQSKTAKDLLYEITEVEDQGKKTGVYNFRGELGDVWRGDEANFGLLERKMQTGRNLTPVFISVKNPFDYEDKKQVAKVINKLTTSDLAGDKMEKLGLFKSGQTFEDQEKIIKDYYRDKIASGDWRTIETPEVQEAIRDLKHDGFYAAEDHTEGATKNLAVYSKDQAKSAVGNVGAYGQRAVTEEEAKGAGLTQEEAQAAQKEGDIRFSIRAPNTPEFKRWFGNSKVVDAEGKPLMVYHASTTFEGYEFKKSPKINRTGNPDGYYFSSRPDRSADYVRDLEYLADRIENPEKYDQDEQILYAQNAELIPVYLKIENPYIYGGGVKPNQAMVQQFKKELKADNPSLGNSWINEKVSIFKEGRFPNISFPTDAMTRVIQSGGYDGMKDGSDWVAFEPTQIKSAIGNRGTYDPTNPDIRYSLRAPQTEAFKRWFGDSKVVDAEGKPLVVYHGTTKNFNAFNTNPKSEMGAHFGTSVQAASFGEKEKGRIIPAFLSIKNPYEAQVDLGTWANVNNWKEYLYNWEADGNGPINPTEVEIEALKTPADVRKLIESRGFDGIEYYNQIEGEFDEFGDGRAANNRAFIAFSPTQIKSATGNIGTYDIANPDIRYSLRSTVNPAITARMEQTTTARKQEGFIKNITTAFRDPDFRSKFRAQTLNRYNRLSEYDKIKLQQSGGMDLYADATAESAALMSDLGAGILASAFGVHDKVGGAPVYKRHYIVQKVIQAPNGMDTFTQVGSQYSDRATAESVAQKVGGVVRERGYTGVSNFDGSVKGPLAIFAPLAKYKDPEIYRYYQFWAGVRRGTKYMALPLPGGGFTVKKENLFDPKDIAKADELEKQFPEFKTVKEEWIKYNDQLVNYMRDTGVISKEQADEFIQHGDYMPFYRQTEDGADPIGPRIFQSIGHVQAPKKLKHGEDPLGDFLENVVRNSEAAIQSGVKNIAARRAADVGMDVGTVKKLDHVSTNPNDFYVMENGKKVYYKSSDILFIEAIKSLGLPNVPFIGILAAPANVLRNLVTRDPGFMLANMMRDSLSAWATTGVKMTPMVATLKNFATALADKSPEMKAMHGSGVLGGYEYSKGVQDAAKQFEKELSRHAGAATTKEKALRPVTYIWEALEKGTSASDAATRIEVYKKTLQETGNEAEALFRSLEVMNFNRKGANPILRVATAAIPFLNARMQGLDVLYRAGFGENATKNAKEIQKTFFIRGATMMALSSMYWMLTHDDDDYKKQEQETRDNNWLLPSLGIRIPIPFEVGVMFKVIPERILELTFGQDTVKDFTVSMARQLASTLAFNPIPQAALPIVEYATNYSFFTGRPIVGQGMENVSPAYQAGPGTSRVAQTIGEATKGLPSYLQLSPLKIDQLINGYTGTMGMYMVDLMDSIYDMHSDSPKPSKRFEQLPVFKRFLVDPEARGQVTSYYDLKNSVDEATRTENLLQRSMKFEDYGQYMKDNIKMFAVKSYVLDLEKTMKQYNEMKLMIRNSKMDADAKRDALLNIQRAENQLTKNIQMLKKNID